MTAWEQHLRALLWLRWRLTRNQWSRGGQLNAVLSTLALIAGLVLAVAGGIGGVLGGAFGLARLSPVQLMLVWDGAVAVFLFFWLIGIVAEIQRAEMIDPGRLLHLPVSPKEVFLLNYVVSHFTPSLVIMVPLTLGLAVGLVAGRSLAMALLIPLLLGFFFMVTAWTYCLRGWLTALMVNKRRRRAIVMGITVGLVVLSQLPNLFTNVFLRPDRHGPGQPPAWTRTASRDPLSQGATEAHAAVPFLWLPYGARALAEGSLWPALLGTAGLFAIGALGLGRAYRATLSFYRGGPAAVAAKPPPVPVAESPAGVILVEYQLPALPAEAAAVALASFRGMTRAPEVKMALAMNVVIFGIMGVGIFCRGSDKIPASARPFMASAAAVVALLGLAQLLFNQFGFDRAGFRALVLLPAPRRHVLLGKNLALLPWALGVFFIFLALTAALARPSPAAILAAGLQFGGAYLTLCALGNLASIVAPYRIAAGALKPTKLKASTTWLLFFMHSLMPLALAPIMIPAGLGLLCDHFGWLPGVAVNLVLSLALAAFGAAVYWLTLGPLGGLLQRRERDILDVVTKEVE